MAVPATSFARLGRVDNVLKGHSERHTARRPQSEMPSGQSCTATLPEELQDPIQFKKTEVCHAL